MASTLELIAEILMIVGFIVLISSTMLFYKKYKFGAVRYFFYATLILGQRGLSFLSRPNTNENRIIFGSLSLDLIGLILSLYCILLFFESFESETPYTKQNLAILVAISAVVSGLFILTIIVQKEEFSLPTGEGVRLADLNYGMLFTENFYILLIFFVFSLFGLILLLIQSLIIMRFLQKKEKSTQNPEAKMRFSHLKRAMYILPLIIPIFIRFEQFSRFLFVVIAVYLSISIYKGGLFMFRSEMLRLLMVIDDSGIPSYSFRFRDVSGTQMGDDDEMLFSGALKAVSMLFQNLTGSDVDLKEIVLENAHLMIQRIPDAENSNSAVLVANKSSKFYQEALSLFAEQYAKIYHTLPKLQVISGEKRNEVDDIVKQCFGII
jgi:hypothetical protein